MHVVNVTWTPNHEGIFSSGLTYWDQIGESLQFCEIKTGAKISWVILGPRKCIGFNNENGRPVRCPEHSTIAKGSARCGPCSALDVYDVCVWCTGSSCDAEERRRESCLGTDYVVYLAVFSQSSLKVGVSSKHRVMTRWVEQGADYAAIVTHVKGGLEARKLESSLGRSSKVTKSMRSTKKANLLMNRVSPMEAEELIDDFISSSSLLDNRERSVIYDLSKHYGLGPIDSKPQQWYNRTDEIAGRKILGEVVGMKGSLLITRIDSVLTVHDLKQLTGFTIDTSQSVEIVTQTGLGDFF